MAVLMKSLSNDNENLRFFVDNFDNNDPTEIKQLIKEYRNSLRVVKQSSSTSMKKNLKKQKTL